MNHAVIRAMCLPHFGGVGEGSTSISSTQSSPYRPHICQVISRLRAELDASKQDQQYRGGSEGGGGRTTGSSSSAAEARRLREENGALRMQLKQLDRAVRVGCGSSVGVDVGLLTIP